MIRKHNLYALIFLAGAGANSVEASFGKMMLNGARSALHQSQKAITQARAARRNLLQRTEATRRNVIHNLNDDVGKCIARGMIPGAGVMLVGTVLQHDSCIAQDSLVPLGNVLTGIGENALVLSAMVAAVHALASVPFRVPFATALVLGYCAKPLHNTYMSYQEKNSDV